MTPDLDQIRTLQARFARFVDTKDWAGLATLWAPDAALDLGGGAIVGAEAVVAAIRDPMEPMDSLHHALLPELELTSETTATGIWAMTNSMSWPQDGATMTRSADGYYHAEYVQLDGRWVFQALRVETRHANVARSTD